MTPATIIREAQAEGVRLALSPAGSVKVTGDGVAVNRWLAVIREHKVAIIEALKRVNGATETASWCWRVFYRDREPVTVCVVPEASLAEILQWRPDALGAEPFDLTDRF